MLITPVYFIMVMNGCFAENYQITKKIFTAIYDLVLKKQLMMMRHHSNIYTSNYLSEFRTGSQKHTEILSQAKAVWQWDLPARCHLHVIALIIPFSILSAKTTGSISQPLSILWSWNPTGNLQSRWHTAFRRRLHQWKLYSQVSVHG